MGCNIACAIVNTSHASPLLETRNSDDGFVLGLPDPEVPDPSASPTDDADPDSRFSN